MNPTSERIFSVLMIDDNRMDVEFMKRALRKAEVPHRLWSEPDGRAGLDRIRQEGTADDRPDLVLLDLNMPVMDGFEVLKELKQDSTLKSIPVVIYSSSSHEGDVALCYSLHANAFIVKPASFTVLAGIGKSICDFWVQAARLPC